MLICSQRTYCLGNNMDPLKNNGPPGRKNVARKSTSNRPLKAITYSTNVSTDNSPLDLPKVTHDELPMTTCLNENPFENTSYHSTTFTPCKNPLTDIPSQKVSSFDLCKSVSQGSINVEDSEEEFDDLEGIFSISASMLKYLKESQLSPPALEDSDELINPNGVLNYPVKYEFQRFVGKEFVPIYPDEFPCTGSDKNNQKVNSMTNLTKLEPATTNNEETLPILEKVSVDSRIHNKLTDDDNLCLVDELSNHKVEDDCDSIIDIDSSADEHVDDEVNAQSEGTLKIEFITTLVDNDLWDTETTSVENFNEEESGSLEENVGKPKSISSPSKINKNKTKKCQSKVKSAVIKPKIKKVLEKMKINDKSSNTTAKGKQVKGGKKKTLVKPKISPKPKRERAFISRQSKNNLKLSEHSDEDDITDSDDNLNDESNNSENVKENLKDEVMKFKLREGEKNSLDESKQRKNNVLDKSKHVGINISDKQNHDVERSESDKSMHENENGVSEDNKSSAEKNKKNEKKKKEINEGVLLHVEAAKKTNIMRDGKLLKDKKELLKDIESTIEKNLPVVVDKEFDIQQSLTEQILLDQALRLAHQRTSPRRRPLLSASQAKALVKKLTSQSLRRQSTDQNSTCSDSSEKPKVVSEKESSDEDISEPQSCESNDVGQEPIAHKPAEPVAPLTKQSGKNKRCKKQVVKNKKIKMSKSSLSEEDTNTNSVSLSVSDDADKSLGNISDESETDAAPIRGRGRPKKKTKGKAIHKTEDVETPENTKTITEEPLITSHYINETENLVPLIKIKKKENSGRRCLRITKSVSDSEVQTCPKDEFVSSEINNSSSDGTSPKSDVLDINEKHLNPKQSTSDERINSNNLDKKIDGNSLKSDVILEETEINVVGKLNKNHANDKSGLEDFSKEYITSNQAETKNCSNEVTILDKKGTNSDEMDKKECELKIVSKDESSPNLSEIKYNFSNDSAVNRNESVICTSEKAVTEEGPMVSIEGNMVSKGDSSSFRAEIGNSEQKNNVSCTPKKDIINSDLNVVSKEVVTISDHETNIACVPKEDVSHKESEPNILLKNDSTSDKVGKLSDQVSLDKQNLDIYEDSLIIIEDSPESTEVPARDDVIEVIDKETVYPVKNTSSSHNIQEKVISNTEIPFLGGSDSVSESLDESLFKRTTINNAKDKYLTTTTTGDHLFTPDVDAPAQRTSYFPSSSQSSGHLSLPTSSSSIVSHQANHLNNFFKSQTNVSTPEASGCHQTSPSIQNSLHPTNSCSSLHSPFPTGTASTLAEIQQQLTPPVQNHSFPHSSAVSHQTFPHQPSVSLQGYSHSGSRAMSYSMSANCGQVTSAVYTSSVYLQNVSQQNNSLQSVNPLIQSQVPTYYNQCQSNFQYPLPTSACHDQYSSQTDRSQVSHNNMNTYSSHHIKEAQKHPTITQDEPKSKSKVVDVPLSILARDPRLRRKNIRIILDSVEFNAPSPKSTQNTKTAPIEESSSPNNPNVKLSESNVNSSRISNTNVDDSEAIDNTKDKTDDTMDLDSVQLPVSPKKKAKKKEVDQELLYKTPLSDLHEERTERSSYSRKPSKFDSPRQVDVGHMHARPSQHQEHPKEHDSESTNHFNCSETISSKYKEGLSEYPPAIPPQNFKEPSKVQIQQKEHHRYEGYPHHSRNIEKFSKRWSSEKYSDTKQRDFSENSRLTEQSYGRSNPRYRDYYNDSHGKIETDYRHRKRSSDYTRWDYAHKKVEKFPAQINSESVDNAANSSGWEKDNEMMDLLEGPVQSSNWSFYRRRGISQKQSYHHSGERGLFHRRWDESEEDLGYRRPSKEKWIQGKRIDRYHGPGRGSSSPVIPPESPMSPDQEPVASTQPMKYLNVPQ